MKVQFNDLSDGINIFIPKELLKHVSENLPCRLKVNDIDDLQTEIIDQLRGGFYDQETHLTKFQILIEETILQVVENGEDCVTLTEEDGDY